MNGGWLVDVETIGILLVVWLVSVVANGAWRSRGDAPTDPVRESGPIFPS